MISPEDTFCQKCGAKPGQPCRTTGGNRTTMHATRRDGPVKQSRWVATRLECWRTGWKAGADLMSTAQAYELVTAYLAPQDFLDGWTKARHITDREHEKARRRLMS